MPTTTRTRVTKTSLDVEELKAIEEVLFRALTRALRVVFKENLIAGYQPQPATPPTDPAPIFTGTPTAATPLGPVVDPAVINSTTALTPPIPRHEEIKTKKQRKVHRSLNKICKTQQDRPHGYITSDEAAELIGGGQNAKTMIHQWVFAGEVPGILVRGIKPPTKGCNGRLTVDKAKLLARNIIRQENVAVMPQFARHRKAA